MSNEILNFSKIIQETDELVNNYFSGINKVLSDVDVQIKEIIEEYNRKIEDQRETGFNIFNLISDKYYYENFHSDIIAAFLDCSGQHKEEDRFFKILLDLLQKRKPELKINLEDFKKTKTHREGNRIDILVQDDNTGKAIIIENKINNAPDMYRQLPRYVDKIGEDNVVAIIYLPLDPNKKPSEEGWDTHQKEFINSKLLVLSANDFFEGWLKISIDAAINTDSKEILNQYYKLTKKIRGNTMDNKLFEKFYNNIMKNEETFNSTMSLVNMVDEFTLYLAQRIGDRFFNSFSPFEVVKVNQNSATFEWFERKPVKVKIVITCEKGKNAFIYRLRFWDENFGVNGTKNLYEIIKHIKDTDFSPNPNDQNELERKFIFPSEEQKLYDFIERFKEELDKIPNNLFE